MAISLEEKTEAMVSWWSEAHALLLKYRLNRSHLVASVSSSIERRLVYLRRGAAELLAAAKARQLPVSILSAGLGNIIQAFLQLVHLVSLGRVCAV